MGKSLGLIGILIALAVGGYLYTHQGNGGQATPAPRATIDVAGVKNDLVSLANAERGEFALEGKYVSLDELVSKGAISSARTSRPPYTYSADVSGTGFRIVATYGGPPDTGAPQQISIDDSMQIKTE